MPPVRERPLIAVNGLLEPGPSPALKLANRYAEAVLAAGGVPLAIPPVGGAAAIEALLGRVDALLLTGGDDFSMERLGKGATHPAACPVPGEKQDFDVALARAALERDLPVLGICYGMQLLALVGGGELHQHLPEDRPGSRAHSGSVRHPVFAQAGTKLAAILGLQPCEVVSRHHQAVAAVGGPWRVSARDDEGLIEAVEHPARSFALGVQWHPELVPEDGRILCALVDAARLQAASPA
jgi:putative glutamine amidotransferase